ncbi:rRNA biogenesis protein [Caldisphaera lagunensis DSM 15908]|uniref:rRNA biogenesis protein n=1 Tax=Caldisphaera lagunensis (strain DSM 15908 / JCM 11604 / ANMR 0165 / IC-154) TaxID=1056495 RepID=L0A8C2_CALLD|nr:rRNA biogenesis protein [Caldisphaera lagunensis]AFZ70098.1 rRNA biogenesis protein [Caldisphaera lagunensis DSM 15908]
MKIYIVDTINGSYGLNEKGEIVAYEFLPKNYDEAIEQIIKIYKGDVSQTFIKLLDKIIEKKPEEIVVESESEAKYINQKGIKAIVEESNPIAINFRHEIGKKAVNYEFSKDEPEFYNWYFNIVYEFTRRMLRGAAQKRDLLVAQAIRAIDDLDKSVNLYATRLREWYSVHFPELNDLIEDHELYSMLVSELGPRSNFTVENIMNLGLSESKSKKIEEAAKKSIGADVSDKDLEAMLTLAKITNQMYNLRKDLDQYATSVMKEVAPNITELVGPLLGARLISIAGGLERLATMPASTIQVLGAEKALFRALKTGGRPPKHGIIFQYPEIYKSPKWQRGKIARALAAKLAIAAKVDAFSGRFIGDKLKEELEKRIEEIKKIYASPKKKETQKQSFQRPQGRGKPSKYKHGRNRR